MSETYKCSYTVKISSGSIQIFKIKKWLREIGCELDFDYTLEYIEPEPALNENLGQYLLHFDDPRHATAFKLVWG